jgi:Mrp family chromosome partitioning ATPase
MVTRQSLGAAGKSLELAGPAAQPPDRPARFRPQWEVDTFDWPTVCLRVAERVGGDLRRAIQDLTQRSSPAGNVLLMTGRSRGEGRTTLAICLARQAAREGASVALIDADFTNPQLANRLGIAAELGLESVVGGPDNVDAACIQAVSEKVSLLPLMRRLRPDDSQWQPRTATAVARLAQEFDLVVVDAGPISQNTVDLSRDIRPLVELAAVIVHDARKTTREELQSVATRVHEAQLRMVGIIENFAA